MKDEEKIKENESKVMRDFSYKPTNMMMGGINIRLDIKGDYSESVSINGQVFNIGWSTDNTNVVFFCDNSGGLSRTCHSISEWLAIIGQMAYGENND